MKTFGPAAPWEADDALSRRAAGFFERRRFGEWSDADQAELDAWLAESVLHRVAYLRMEGIAAHAKRLAALPPAAPSGNAPDRNGKAWLRLFMFPLLAAASLIAFIVYGIPLVVSLMQPPIRTYSTDIGGRSLLSFADHTQIELNTDTTVRFRMTNKERTVWLDKGEAWFHVAHDAGNPFILFIGKNRVTDLGTEFVVRRGTARMEVALLQGRVGLSAQGAPTTTLVAGDDAVATPISLSVTRKTPQQLSDELAWRRGTLVFRKTRLADVVREFNRYNQTKLVVADPSIADVKISAELKTDDYEGFLQLAQAVLNLRVDHEGNDILISRVQRERTKRAVHIGHGG